jgi:Ca2+-binding EF-hand superfamily protein
MKTLQAEMASLQRQWKMLAEGLGRSAAGQSLLDAASAGDQAAFNNSLETYGLSGSPSNVQIVASGGKGALLPPNAAEAEAAGTMGEVLKELRAKGMMSATAAFQHFQPGEDGCISTVQFLQEINSFGNISPQRTSHLAKQLDTQSCGRINYQDFRSKISSFLASSRDFHSSLSADELHVVMTRIRTKLHERGITVSDAFKQCHVDASGTLEASEFMAGLRSLHLGLSVKEVAQVLNSLADVARVEGVDSTRVSLSIFENTLLGVSEQNPVKDWAATTYAKLREIVESGAINKSLRFYAEQPEHKHMLFCGFSAFVSDTEPSMSSVEKERLWCVLDKEPSVEDPAVSIAELMQWLAPQR